MMKQSVGAGVALCNLKIDEKDNDYAEIEQAPASTGGGRKEDFNGEENQSRSMKPPSRTIGVGNPKSQAHAENGAIDESPVEMNSGGGYSDFFPLSHIGETDVNLIGMDCVAVQSEQSLKQSVKAVKEDVKDVKAVKEEDVLALALGENCDCIETAGCSSSTTTYNTVANFKVGCTGCEIMNTGENRFWTYMIFFS